MRDRFESDRIIIRKLLVSDFYDVYKNIRNKQVRKWIGAPRSKIFKNPVGRVICRYAGYFLKGIKVIFSAFSKSKTGKVYRFGIVLKETGRVIGIISLTKNSPGDDFADMGFWIGKKYWGKGLMTEALKMGIEFGFKNLELERIEAWTFEKNVGSRKVMGKCGLTLEETVNNAYFKYNENQNRLNFAVSKSEFENIQ